MDTTAYIFLVAFVLILLVLVVSLVVMSYNKSLLFAPYVIPPLSNAIQPLGGVLTLTPQQQYERCITYLGVSDPRCVPPPS